MQKPSQWRCLWTAWPAPRVRAEMPSLGRVIRNNLFQWNRQLQVALGPWYLPCLVVVPYVCYRLYVAFWQDRTLASSSHSFFAASARL